MRERAVPWWMYLAAAGFLAYFVLLAWCGLRGVAEPGITADFDSHTLAVKLVRPDSPAARAGLLAGDKLIAPDGAGIRTRFDWMALTGNWEAGTPARFLAERGGDRHAFTLDVGRRSWTHAGPGSILIAVLLWGARLVTLGAAIMIAFRRPDSMLARVGAWFLATASVSSVVVLPGSAAAWRHLPPALGALLWAPALSTVVLPAIFFTFFAQFPKSEMVKGWMWAVAWLPAAAQLGGIGRFLYATVYHPHFAMGMTPYWFLTVYLAVALGYLGGGILIQAANCRRLEGANDRRCACMLALGATAGWAAVAPIVVLDWRGGASSLAPAFFSAPAAVVSAALFLACVALLSYTLLRKRVFGFSVMIRQGLRYALARRFLVSIAPAAGALLLADLLLHGSQPLIEILEARGWAYAALAGVALFAQSRRERWLESLDRRFFRESYDAKRLLIEVAEMVRQATALEQVAPRVVARIEAALHPGFASLMVRGNAEPDYRSIAAAPAGHAPPPLPAGSKLASLLRVLGKPIELTLTSGWLREQLPAQDADFIRRAHIDLLVPVATGASGKEAILAMGAKRSEEPYTDEDRDLLAAIAASLAVLADRPTPGGAVVSEANSFCECPSCGACYDSAVENCAKEGASLTRRSVPRLLVGRYRLEKRLGGGGMGTVYEAIDLALDRRVAAKMIHDHMVGSADAAERFRREARAAAAFSHPNIVTVHDFGIVAGTRAFLVMELLKGVSLREELRETRHLSPERVLFILQGVCDAVGAAHRRQLIHRDLKPENIFLARGEGGEIPKVLDFGVAKSLRPATSSEAETLTLAETGTGILVGTFPYMPPEQLLGEQPQPRWDLWALAVVTYEMLTGSHPFPTGSRIECRDAVLAGRFEPATKLAPGLSPLWDKFFARALAPDPGLRPHSAREFLSEIESAAG